jgi:hypothetical protein
VSGAAQLYPRAHHYCGWQTAKIKQLLSACHWSSYAASHPVYLTENSARPLSSSKQMNR